MNCNLLLLASTSLLLIVQIISSLKIRHPALWLKSHSTLLLTANREDKISWKYIARAHKTQAYKKCILIQNIDGSTLRYNDLNRTFSLSATVPRSKFKDLNTQMFILTLNLQAVKISDQDNQRMIKIIRRYIKEDNSSGKNFILIRAVYWPYYLCSDSQSVIYGAAINKNTLSHDCIWYRVLTPSGYMHLLKLHQMPFYDVTYHNSDALSSYPKNNLTLLRYGANIGKSSYWAMALSHLSIPRYRYQRSVALQFNNKVSSKLQWIIEHYKDQKKSILPEVCFKLDKKIQEDIKFQHEIYLVIHEIRNQSSYLQSNNVSDIIDKYIEFLPSYYSYKIKIESYTRSQRFFKRYNLTQFYERNEIRIRNLTKEFSTNLIYWNGIRFDLCRSLTSSNSCMCITPSRATDVQCYDYDYYKHMAATSSLWARMPSDEHILLANIYRQRYRGATSILALRRLFFLTQQIYQNLRSSSYYDKAKVCL